MCLQQFFCRNVHPFLNFRQFLQFFTENRHFLSRNSRRGRQILSLILTFAELTLHCKIRLLQLRHVELQIIKQSLYGISNRLLH